MKFFTVQCNFHFVSVTFYSVASLLDGFVVCFVYLTFLSPLFIRHFQEMDKVKSIPGLGR